MLFPFHRQSENFRELFEATADDANIMAENLIMTYRDKRFFPSVTPHTLKIWTETAELGIHFNLTLIPNLSSSLTFSGVYQGNLRLYSSTPSFRPKYLLRQFQRKRRVHRHRL